MARSGDGRADHKDWRLHYPKLPYSRELQKRFAVPFRSEVWVYIRLWRQRQIHRPKRQRFMHRSGWPLRLRWSTCRCFLRGRFTHRIHIGSGKCRWSMCTTLY